MPSRSVVARKRGMPGIATLGKLFFLIFKRFGRRWLKTKKMCLSRINNCATDCRTEFQRPIFL